MKPVTWIAAAALLSTQASQAPVFRSRVDLVTVDVSVLDDRGRPLDGLGPDDFSLEVDGTPRRIVSAQYVPYRGSARTAPGPADARERAALPQVTSNEHAISGRVILIGVDQANIRRTEGQAALRAAAAFIDALDPADRVAAVGVEEAGPLHFTADRAAARRTLTSLTGRGAAMGLQFNLGLTEALAISDGNRTRLDQAVVRICGEPIGRLENPQRLAEADGMRDPCPIQIEQQSRALAQYTRTQSTQSINALKRLIARMGEIEGPKTLVLLSEALIAEPQLVDFSELAALAQKARVTVYVLQLDVPLLEPAEDAISPTWHEDLRLHTDGLTRLAGATGGAVFPLIGTGDRPFRRILSELSGYYLLAFEPSATDRDGRPHRISVRVPRHHAVVRARAAFEIPTVPPGPMSTEQRLVQLLRTPRVSTELPLRLATYSARAGTAGQVRTIVGIEAADEPTDITFGFVIVDDGGVVATSATHRSTTGRYSFPAVLETGRYLLRAAAIDAAGRAGTVERALDVRLHGSAAARTSDLVLAEHTDRGGSRRPIVERTKAPAIDASVEVYASRDWSPDGAVVFELRPGGGHEPIRSAPGTPRWSRAGHWTARAELNLAALQPGRYIVTAIVRFQTSAPADRVSRAFVLVK